MLWGPYLRLGVKGTVSEHLHFTFLLSRLTGHLLNGRELLDGLLVDAFSSLQGSYIGFVSKCSDLVFSGNSRVDDGENSDNTEVSESDYPSPHAVTISFWELLSITMLQTVLG